MHYIFWEISNIYSFSGLNVVGLCEPLFYNFGLESGTTFQFLHTGYWAQFAYSTIILVLCIGVCLIGSQAVSKASTLSLGLLILATLSIPISCLFVKPFEIPIFDSFYTGITWTNFKANLLPNYTKGAAGSILKRKENFRDLFGVFFPATAGIFAGASMSGDLRKPSKSIPKGTLWGLGVTFICYFIVIVSMGSAIPRDLLYKDVQVIQTVSISKYIILIGEISNCLFSVITGIVGASKILEAIAKDNILPGLDIFTKTRKNSDDPVAAIFLSYLLVQIILFFDVNSIANFIAMAFLMTFIVTNLACFLLKIGNAPNFRPSFKYFSKKSAFAGVISCIIAMFMVDGMSTCGCFIILMLLFLLIHYVCPPKQWGDVSQSLIYHQVRKYLLRLRQDNVKYWRPQILLLVDNPRTSWKLLHFCNHLKKGGLYMLGHVCVIENFNKNFSELNKQKNAWTKLRDAMNIKAFVQIATGPNFVWSARNVYLGSGLGGMRPNITVLGFFELKNHIEDDYSDNDKTCNLTKKDNNKKRQDHIIDIEDLPTDGCRQEKTINVQEWVHLIEDLLIMQATIAITKGFQNLDLPNVDIDSRFQIPNKERYIDLYPIQMAAEVINENGEANSLTTNFDTYTLILQLGAILETVPHWHKTHKLRVIVFVEHIEEVFEETKRVKSLLASLRINAKVIVLCLSSGKYDTYEILINGKSSSDVSSYSFLNKNEIENILQLNKDFPLMVPTKGNLILKEPFSITKRRFTMANISNSKFMQLGHRRQLSMTTGHLFPKTVYNSSSSDEEDGLVSESDVDSAYGDKISSTDISSHGKVKEDDSPSGIQYSRNSELKMKPSLRRLSLPSITNRYAPTTSSSQRSPNPSRSRPNFSSQAIPQPEILDTDDGRPTIKFAKELPPPRRVLKTSSFNTRQLQNDDYFGGGIPKRSPNIAPKSPSDYSVPLSPKCGGSILDSSSSSPKFEEDKDDDEYEHLSFNDLPARQQHVILNELMKKTSSKASVIFSTLPSPQPGTHLSQEDSLQYVKDLDAWCHDLPPIMLINSQSITVTTSL